MKKKILRVGENLRMLKFLKFVKILFSILSENIQRRFNPPRTPHHGSLWKAAVISMKQHLRKTTVMKTFIHEEFLTLLCRIAVGLNLRPITDISDDPNDISNLTPRHFLIRTSLTAQPEII